MRHKVVLEFDDTVNPMHAGFRVNWVDGENKTERINVSCGAGVGNPFVIFSITDKKSDKTRYAVADISPLILELAASMKKARKK